MECHVLDELRKVSALFDGREQVEDIDNVAHSYISPQYILPQYYVLSQGPVFAITPLRTSSIAASCGDQPARHVI
jgi:hypothetical protein